MIEFKAQKHDEKIVKISVSGHSGYADEGSDIVCAAVSVAVQMTITGIEEQKLADVDYRIDDGFLECNIPIERDAGADLLLNSLMITIREIGKQYRQYVLVMEV